MATEFRVFLCIIALILTCIVAIPCFFAVYFGWVDPYIEYFGVDSTNRIYILHGKNIFVYEQGVLLNTIDLETSFLSIRDEIKLRSPGFTITPEDVILLETDGYICILDLQGNVLHYKVDSDNTYMMLSKMTEVVTSNGDIYRRENTLGRTAIIKNDLEIVYQITVPSMVVKWCLGFSAIMLSVTVVTLLRYSILLRREGY